MGDIFNICKYESNSFSFILFKANPLSVEDTPALPYIFFRDCLRNNEYIFGT